MGVKHAMSRLWSHKLPRTCVYFVLAIVAVEVSTLFIYLFFFAGGAQEAHFVDTFRGLSRLPACSFLSVVGDQLCRPSHKRRPVLFSETTSASDKALPMAA